MEDLMIGAIYEIEETSPKQATHPGQKALTVLHYATTGCIEIYKIYLFSYVPHYHGSSFLV